VGVGWGAAGWVGQGLAGLVQVVAGLVSPPQVPALALEVMGLVSPPPVLVATRGVVGWETPPLVPAPTLGVEAPAALVLGW
jgi:hypothetical protein